MSSDSVFGHRAGGWISHIQDTSTRQREGVKHPLFVQLSSFETGGDDPEELLCGTDIKGDRKCKPSLHRLLQERGHVGAEFVE